MIKLYKKISGKLHYHEAWRDGKTIVEHWGEVGKQGKAKVHEVDRSLSEDESIKNILAKAYGQGYAEIEMDEQVPLIVEYRLDNWGNTADLSKRHALEDKLNEVLGWTGLGMCDGGSIGSGTMEVCCFVVDYAIAEEVIRSALKRTKYRDYSRIYLEDDE